MNQTNQLGDDPIILNSRYLLHLRCLYLTRLLSHNRLPTGVLVDQDFAEAIAEILPESDLDAYRCALPEIAEEVCGTGLKIRNSRIGLDRPPPVMSPAALKIKDAMINALQCQLNRWHSAGHPQSSFERKLFRLSVVLELDSIEADILRLGALYRLDPTFKEVVDILELGELRRNENRFFGLLLSVGEADIQRRLSVGASLRRLGVLVREKRSADLRLAESLVQLLEDPGIDEDGILSFIVSREPAPELQTSDFEHLADHLTNATRLLQGAWRSEEAGVNLLFYGAPGLGKTQFARLVAELSGATTFQLPRVDDDGGIRASDQRRLSLDLFQRMSQGETRPLLIVDEAEGLLSESGGLMAIMDARTDHENAKKGWLTHILESNPVPVLWLVNQQSRIHSAAKRRFSYSVRFTELSGSLSTRLLKRAVHEQGPDFRLPEGFLEGLVDRYPLNPGALVQAVSTWRNMTDGQEPDAAILETVLAQAFELHHDRPAGWQQGRPLDADYDPEILALNGVPSADALARYVQAFYAQEGGGQKHAYQLTLLFHGAPGTGKTELAKYLARRCERKLAVERLSDLLGKYVGESERNLARAFNHAADTRAILLLDEFDALAFDRQFAARRWEVSTTNELLQQIENFPGILIAATNFLEKLDPAVMRRFSHKVQFLGIRPEYRARAVATYFSAETGEAALTKEEEAKLDAMPSLLPGDLQEVRQRLAFDAIERCISTAEIVTALGQAASYRKDSPRRIGFRNAI